MDSPKRIDSVKVNDKRMTISEDTPLAPIQQDGEPINKILALAIQQGAPLEQLEKWMILKRKHDDDEAKKAFFKAVSAFKREEIRIKKDKINSQFNSPYSSLGNLLESVNPFLGKHGLSARFVPSQSDKMITVECVLSHELGHTESVTLSAPPDTSGGNSKNPIQQIKSTFTYLRSATFEAVTGLAGTEASLDDDGNAAGHQVEYISEDQQIEINDLLNNAYKTEVKKTQWLKYMQADSVETIPATKYDKAINSFKRAKEAPKK